MSRRVGMEEYENGTERRAPDWCLVQRGEKRARARGGAGCEGTACRRRAAIRGSGRLEIAKRGRDRRFSPGLSHVRTTECGEVECDPVAELAGRHDARAGAIHRAE